MQKATSERPKLSAGHKRTVLALTMTLFASGCVTLPVGTSLQAYCATSAAARTAHAGALLDDGGPVSLRTGEAVLSGAQAACQ